MHNKKSGWKLLKLFHFELSQFSYFYHRSSMWSSTDGAMQTLLSTGRWISLPLTVSDVYTSESTKTKCGTLMWNTNGQFRLSIVSSADCFVCRLFRLSVGKSSGIPLSLCLVWTSLWKSNEWFDLMVYFQFKIFSYNLIII